MSKLLLSLLLLAPPVEPVQHFQMELGQQRSFLAEGLEKLMLSGEAVEIRRLGEEEFALFATREGKAQLTLILHGGRFQLWEIEVKSSRQEQWLDTCRELFGPELCHRLELVEAGQKLVLKAKISDLETYRQVQEILRLFPEIHPLVEVEPSVLDELARFTTTELHRAGFEKVEVVRIGRRLILEGSVDDEQEKLKVHRLFQELYQYGLNR